MTHVSYFSGQVDMDVFPEAFVAALAAVEKLAAALDSRCADLEHQAAQAAR